MLTRRRIGNLSTKQIKELGTKPNPLRHWSWRVPTHKSFKFITVDVHVRLPYTWKSSYGSFQDYIEARELPWNKKQIRKSK